MKQSNYLSAVGTMAAICAAGLFLFALPARSSVIINQVLTFDQLADNSPVPDGYGSVNWTNFFSINASGGTNNPINPSGYEYDMVSTNNVLYDDNGAPAAVYSDGNLFILTSAYLAAAWNDHLQVQVNGYLGNRLVFSRTYTLNATQRMRVLFPPLLVTEVDFIPSGGTHHAGYPGTGEHFAADNMSIVVLPFRANPSPLHLPAAN